MSIVARATVLRGQSLFFDSEDQCDCFHSPPVGDVVAVRVGDGVQVVVACIECGTRSNAAKFVEACTLAKARAPAEPPELAAAYCNWLVGRLQQTGTMTGCAPRGQEMERQPRAALATPFVKTIGPLPADLGLDLEPQRSGSTSRMYNGDVLSMGMTLDKEGKISHPKASTPFADQLNAGDRIHSINGVWRPARQYHRHNFLVAAQQAGQSLPPSQPRYATVISTMPYFQPNHLVTVALPSGAELHSIGLESNEAKPPKLGPGASASASSVGLLPNDVIVQAVVDDTTLDATSMTAADLLARAGSAAGGVKLVVLQNSRVPMSSHMHSWPRGREASGVSFSSFHPSIVR